MTSIIIFFLKVFTEGYVTEEKREQGMSEFGDIGGQK